LGPWAPIGAEQTASGYEVGWKAAGADQYSVWNTDNSGNFIPSTSIVSGADYTLQSFEPSFHQDLNGDGQIGVPTTVIEANGSTHLTEVGNHFFLYDSNGAGPSLKFFGADIVAGQFAPGWAPIGAEQTANGYEVVWKATGANQYSVWNTDNSGNFVSSTSVVSGADNTLQSLEPSFHQDLNRDGQIGPPAHSQLGTDGLWHQFG
jgi:serralysin